MLDHPELELPDHYVLKSKLGEGGMGEVYLAEDTRLKRHVAIKRLKRQQGEGENSQKLQHEAILLAQLNHTNVVQVYDIIDLTSETVLVMEYVEGKTLGRHLQEQVVTYYQRLVWLLQIAQGLAAAHKSGLVHKDLKLDNVLISAEGAAKITDFGIAIQVDAERSQNTGDDTSGTVTALSPEQALGENVTTKSDLFSFGILVFRLLCNRHPFGEEGDKPLLIKNLICGAVQSPRAFNPALSDELSDFILQLLSVKPEDRPESASLVCKKLKAHIEAAKHSETFHEMSLTFPVTVDIAKELPKQPDNEARLAPETTVSHYSLRRLSPLLGLALVTMLLAVGLTVGFKKSNRPMYVALMPIEMKSDGAITVAMQQRLEQSFSATLEQAIIEADNRLVLIRPKDMSLVQGEPRDIAEALSADIILESYLDCREFRCDVQLDRIEQRNNETHVSWLLKGRQRWPILVDEQYLNFSLALKERIALLFPKAFEQVKNPSYTVSESAYLRFLDLRQAVLIEGQTTAENWSEMRRSQTQYLGYLPFYELASRLALDLYNGSRNTEYLDQLEQVLDNSNIRDSSLVRTTQFEIALHRQDFVGARQKLDQLIDDGLDEAAVLQLEASLASYAGDYVNAAKYYEKAIALYPSVSLIYDAAFNEYFLGNLDDSKQLLERIFALSPDYYPAHVLLATTYVLSGQLESAAEQYEKVIEINDETHDLVNLGVVYELLGEYERALPLFTEAVQRNPDHPHALVNLADIQSLLNNTNIAAEIYEKILALVSDSEDWEHVMVRSQAEIHLGKTHEALKSVHHSISLSGETAELMFNAALVYSLAEQWSASLVYMEQSLEMGMGEIWFDLPWFNGLCHSEEREAVIAALGAERCATDSLVEH